jgi:hypothetical protein
VNVIWITINNGKLEVKPVYILINMLLLISKGGKARHPVFREYFDRKVKEGKTKPQALVCVMRRAVNIIYGMMKNKTAYVPYEKQD